MLKPWTLERLIAWTGHVAAVALFLGITAYVGWLLNSSIEESLEKRARTLASAMASQAADLILTNNSFALSALLRAGVAGEPDVQYAFVHGQEGGILAHTFEDGFPTELNNLLQDQQVRPVRFRTKEGAILDVPIRLMDGQLGEIHVGISRAGAIAGRRELVLSLVAILIPALAITLYVANWIGRIVSKPLQVLAEAARKVPSGQTSPEQIPLKGTAEVYALSKAFREMVAELGRLKTQEKVAQDQMVSAERLAALGELAAGLAHEIINPLDGVMECSRLLEAEANKSDRLKKYLPLIRDGLARINRVMRQMLTLAQQSPEVPLRRYNIGQLVQGVAGLVEMRLAKRGIDLSKQIDEKLDCLCSKEFVEQTILNIVLNAADAVSGMKTPKIQIVAERRDRWLKLHIDDSGGGVPKDLRERIFAPFFTTKEPGKGTGLGLTVSRQLMRRCGGDLVLDEKSSVLGGARFTIILPGAESLGACK